RRPSARTPSGPVCSPVSAGSASCAPSRWGYYGALGRGLVPGPPPRGGVSVYSITAELSHTSSLTLTLAGVTGIIVSVGITVDSYVVYFERLKDEVRSGRTVRQSTERSFSRAFRTVLTADFVAFIAAFSLYEFTVGDGR